MFSIPVFLSPNSNVGEVKEEKERKTFFGTLKQSILRIVQTFYELKSNKQYLCVAWFLLAYFFFSTSGTVFTIFLSSFFIQFYDVIRVLKIHIDLHFSWICKEKLV